MKRTFNLIFCFLLTMLFFIACSNTEQNTEQTEEPTQQAEVGSTPTPTPTTTPTQEPQVTGEEENIVEENVYDNNISWEDFVELYDGEMPDFTSLCTFSLCESYPNDQGGYRICAYFKQIEEGDFDKFIDFSLDKGYECTLTIKSEYIMDNTKYPLVMKDFIGETEGSFFQIIHMQQGIEQIVIEYRNQN